MAAYYVSMARPESPARGHGPQGCDSCGGPLPAPGGYGTGRLSDGLYCSLECLARVVYAAGEPLRRRVGPPTEPRAN